MKSLNQRLTSAGATSRQAVLFRGAVPFAIALIVTIFVGNFGNSRSQAAPPVKNNRAPNAQPKNRPSGSRLPTAGATSDGPVKIKQVDPQRTAQVAASAAKIDELVAANYLMFNVQPNPLTTDEQFVRRIYLDIAGTIPTYQQAKSFIESSDPHKRAKLIDQLLNSPGYASHYFNYWGNILRLTDNPDPNIFGEPYNEWVKQSIRDNLPFDQMVREMLTAEGKVWENPAAGYLLRDAGMPLDSMNNTVRIFLGTQIGCAQCHNHPFDRWKQREFYEMAAFTFGTKTRLDRRDPEFQGNPLVRLRAELAKIDPSNKGVGYFQRLVRANSYVVRDEPRTKLKLPHDYTYKDGKPDDVVSPKVIFGQQPAISPGESPRQAFAMWLTSKDNPRFALTLANRMWHKLLGVGQIEPVDDVRDDSVAENQPLLDFLTSEFKRLDFDVKEYLRILYNTQTYQRQASTAEVVGDEVYHFPGPVLRRMTAEQVWDSLLTLAVYNPDSFLRPSVKDMADVADLNLANVSALEVLKKSDEFNDRYGRKALFALRKQYSYKGELLVRASELPLPVPPEHFLRQFGQGDRELIDGETPDGSVPQVLTMFNGLVTHMMLEQGSVIYDNVTKSPSLNEQIEVIFLSLLSRKPTAADRTLAFREIQRGGPAGYGNVIWALVNTREFLFIQ